jgi:Trp operon repressor
MAKVQSSQVDIRGFKHELEPLQRKYEWQLAACEAQLARCQQAWSQSKAALQDLQSQHQQHLAWARDLAQQRFDPQSHQRLLTCLVRLDERIQKAERVLHERLLQKQKYQAECNAQRQKIEALETHRDSALQSFVEERSRIQFSQQDRDWMAHRSVQSSRAVLIQPELLSEA